jgi:hypothetical protein
MECPVTVTAEDQGPLSRMTLRMSSAVLIPSASVFSSSGCLPPFAMWAAFPPSDYYEGSVALGLAPRRRSRVPLSRYVQRGLGSPLIRWRSSFPRPLTLGGARPSPGAIARVNIGLGRVADG